MPLTLDGYTDADEVRFHSLTLRLESGTAFTAIGRRSDASLFRGHNTLIFNPLSGLTL